MSGSSRFGVSPVISAQSPSDESTVDAVVIGGGFFGCETALELKRLGFSKIMVVEREPGLLRRASFVNQARVHGGYHYPRAQATALRSRKSFERFVVEYSDAIVRNLKKYYAIARGSRVTGDQFASFCTAIGAVHRPAPYDVERLFVPGMIERVFEVEEFAFDAVRLADRLRSQLRAARIDVCLNSEARISSSDQAGVDVDISGEKKRARFVFNCTYSQLPFVGVELGTRIKRELTEMLLINPPPQIRGRGFTIMDGPFFSTMPFPPSGLHSLSHVRYTPHEASFEGEQLVPGKTNGLAMLRDAARYMPCLSQAKIVQSMFEIKAVLLRNELDDARPILIEPLNGEGRVFSILGAKIDNVFDLQDFLRGQTWN
jgi:glycine/D-amino acid oxidase-like deaminating enzyme